MKKAGLLLGVLAMILALVIISGCGEKDAQAQTCAGCGMTLTEGHSKMVDGKAYCSHCAEKMAATQSAKNAADQVAVHDCDGKCGMKDVPVTQLTELNGKYYCKGCVAKMNTKAKGDHPSHNH